MNRVQSWPTAVQGGGHSGDDVERHVDIRLGSLELSRLEADRHTPIDPRLRQIDAAVVVDRS